MATITPSEQIAGVVIVEPDVHGDERGFFVETYRREWFPQGREMIQGNRGDRQAGRHRRAPLPPAPGRLLVRPLRHRPGGAPRPAHRFADRRRHPVARPGRPGRRRQLAPRRVHPAGRGPRVRGAHRHDHHLPGRRLLQPGRRARRGLGRPRDRRRLGGQPIPSCRRGTRPTPGGPTSSPSGSPTRRCGPDRSGPLACPTPSPNLRGLLSMKLFVTGAAGFIGSNYVRHVLATSDDEVTVFDALTYAGNRSTSPTCSTTRRCRFVHGDICDRDAVAAAPWPATTPWCTSRPRATSTARSSTRTRSCAPTASAPTSCATSPARSGVERFLHISTDEVYGSIDEGSFTETDRLGPRSPYSRVQGRLGPHRAGVPARPTACRCWSPARRTTSGPTSSPRRSSRCSSPTCSTARRCRSTATGCNIRDWMLRRATTAPASTWCCATGEIGEIYNIGGGNETTNRELTETRARRSCGAGEDMIEHVDDRLGHDRRYSIDCSKAHALGWEPARSLDEALAATVDWYRDQPGLVGTAAGAPECAMRVLVTGAGGQVGHRARRRASRPRATDERGRRSTTPTVDLTDRDAVLGGHHGDRAPTPSCTRRRGPPSTRCEADPDRAFRVNALGTRHVAEGARRVGAPVLLRLHRLRLRRHQGRALPRVGPDPTPQSVYGALEAGRGARARPRLHRRPHLVGVRPPRRQHGQDHPPPGRRARHAALRRRPARPPHLRRRPGRDDRAPGGRAAGRALFHVTNQGAVSWYEFAREVLEAGRARPRPGASPSPPPTCTRPGRRPGRPTRCSTTPRCASRASRCSTTSASRSPSWSAGCRRADQNWQVERFAATTAGRSGRRDRHPGRAGRLEGGDLVLVLQRDADVVEPLQEPVARGVVERELDVDADGRAPRPRRGPTSTVISTWGRPRRPAAAPLDHLGGTTTGTRPFLVQLLRKMSPKRGRRSRPGSRSP